jgi:hypothetical protein
VVRAEDREGGDVRAALAFLAALFVHHSVGAACLTDQVLLLNVYEPTLVPYVEQSIAKFNLLGYNVAVDPNGVPVGLDPRVTTVDAITGFHGHPCIYSHCNAVNSYVRVAPSMMQRSPAFILVSMEHEISHLISGFGSCVTPAMELPMKDGMHLVPGNLISNGNSNYGTFSFTEKDLILLHSCL